MPQHTLVGTRPVADTPLEIAEILPRDGDAFRLVLDKRIDDAVRRLHLDRPDILGPENAQTASLDHRGPTHSDVRCAVGDDNVATAEQRSVASEAAAGDDSHDWHLAVDRTQSAEGRGFETRRRRPFVAGPAATAFGKHHNGQRPLVGEPEQAILLLVIDYALRPREDRVVVGHNGATRLFF